MLRILSLQYFGIWDVIRKLQCHILDQLHLYKPKWSVRESWPGLIDSNYIPKSARKLPLFLELRTNTMKQVLSTWNSLLHFYPLLVATNDPNNRIQNSRVCWKRFCEPTVWLHWKISSIALGGNVPTSLDCPRGLCAQILQYWSGRTR